MNSLYLTIEQLETKIIKLISSADMFY